jgi:hypothetical protein
MPALAFEVRDHLVKAREAALQAVEIYNKPNGVFRTGTYLVLMILAWTSLFHAIFLKRRKKPYYRRQGSNRFVKVDGEYKAWELGECLNQFYGADYPATRKNLEFLIGLRNKVEHRILPALDNPVFGECQACLLNFEKLLCAEFGDKYALRAGLAFALQFSEIGDPTQLQAMQSAGKKAFQTVLSYVDTFRSGLSTDVQSSQDYSYKVFLVPKIGRDAKGSDVAVEFVKYDPTKPEEMAKYERLVALIKPKFVSVANLNCLKPGQVVERVKAALQKKFTQRSHLLCYRHYNVRPKRGDPPEFSDTRYCYYDQAHDDYVYTPAWVEFLVSELSDPDTYSKILDSKPPTPAPSAV